MTDTFPSLFISHGAPSLALDDAPVRDFLRSLSGAIAKPRAVLMISAHFVSPSPVLTASPAPETIYDFRGFSDELYEMTYPAPGAPTLAEEISATLQDAGFNARTHPTRGLDHGAWVPLQLLYPETDIPVIQLSISMSESPEWHYRLGQALAPLREQGVLIIGSGGTTHNLNVFFNGNFRLNSAAPEWVSPFADWISERVEAGDHDSLINAMQMAPFATENHPSMDHILPLFVALGAGGIGAGQTLHTSLTYGVLAMNAYAFGTTIPQFSQTA